MLEPFVDQTNSRMCHSINQHDINKVHDERFLFIQSFTFKTPYDTYLSNLRFAKVFKDYFDKYVNYN